MSCGRLSQAERRLVVPDRRRPRIDAAVRLGALCLPAGGLSSLARLRLLADHRATVVLCTPTYALRLAEVAREHGLDLAAVGVRALVVAGEPGGSIPATRGRIEGHPESQKRSE